MRGKKQKIALFALAYGSSKRSAAIQSGVGLRTVNELSKELKTSGFKVARKRNS